jgi:inosose dehydratase
MGLTIAMCPDTWGIWFPEDERQPSWSTYLDEVAEAGYRLIELGPLGYLPTDRARLADELAARGISVIAGTIELSLLEPSAGLNTIKEYAARVSELAGALGARFVVLIPRLNTDMRTGAAIGPDELDGDAWREFVGYMIELGEFVATEFGLTLTFHPHVDSAVQYERQVVAFLTDTAGTDVALCLDTGHFEYRGGDSVALFRDWHSRVPYLHLKDVDPTVRKQVATTGVPFVRAVEQRVFCEAGKGLVKFDRLAEVMASVDYHGWGGIETDMFPLSDFGEPLRLAHRTREYFQRLGWTTGSKESEASSVKSEA